MPRSDLLVPRSDLLVPRSDLLEPRSDLLVPSSDLLVPSSDLLVPSSDLPVPNSDSLVSLLVSLTTFLIVNLSMFLSSEFSLIIALGNALKWTLNVLPKSSYLGNLQPYSLQESQIFSIPRPQCSMNPAL